MRNYLCFFLIFSLAVACTNDTASDKEKNVSTPLDGLTITSKEFGQTPDGIAHLYTIKNKNGVTISISNYGGIITELKTPDRNGVMADVVLGFDSLSGYLSSANPYFGGIIGRYGNRIGKGKFSLNGQVYQLANNDNTNHLHGGNKGFDKVLWSINEVKGGDAMGVELTYTSKDMEEGYPGNLAVKVVYLLNNANEILIRYEAKTDKPTICNLTNHTYFNLAGEGNGDILGHRLSIAADWITPVDETLIPTGEMMPVEGTPFDFRVAKEIGKEIADTHPQMKYGNGYDHNFVVGNHEGERTSIASAYEPISGRYMEVFTQEPAVQFYTGNFLDGTIAGKNGHKYGFRTGFCLETQHFPDSPNQDDFPSTVLLPNDLYETSTVYKFSVKW